MLLFCAATATEWRAAYPQATGALPEHTLLHFSTGQGQEQEHCLCITGVGLVNAALAAGLCLAREPRVPSGPDIRPIRPIRPFRAVVNVGVAGSFDLARAPLGSVWRVNREIWPEYGLADDTDVQAEALGFAQWCDAQGQDVWQSLDLNAEIPEIPALAGLHLPEAASLSVAGVTNSLDRAARLCAKYGALLENMEGFALALACARLGLPLLEVRAVSNLVGSRAPQHRDFACALAALAPVVHKLLEKAHA